MVKKPEITQLFLTKNNCYKTGKKIKPIGIMRHSTGANNPKLSRYVGPDDGILGKNPYGNHWNQPKPGGRSVCVHAFIGKDKNGKVRIYQTLPWDHLGWHSGVGSKGSANTMGYIGYEICEDALNDKKYFDECMRLADQLDAYLLDKFGLKVTPTTLIDHAEGHRLGIASNHGDMSHWLRKHGMTMNDVRARVKKLMGCETVVYYKKGDKGSGVKNLQSDLVKLGYKLDVDGSFGPATDKVVRQFQKDNKLTIDGSAGPATLKKIRDLINDLNKPTPKPSSSNKGFYRVVAGSYQDKKNAEKQMEKLKKLGIDGVFLAYYEK